MAAAAARYSQPAPAAAPPPVKMVGFNIFSAPPKDQPDTVEVWEENWPALMFFMDYCSTQWRHGMNGPTGLCYEAVLPSLRTLRLPREEFDDMFVCIRILERGALDAMRKEG